jgi:cytosine/adenosine deaminase-related metal-dependent hydrolase
MDDAGSELDGASILVKDGWITAVGDLADDGQADEDLDCSRFLAIPGLVNTHHHLYQTLTRAFPESEGRTLFPWLRLLYPIWAGLDEEMIAASTRAGLAELALSGCTTCADHLYVFPEGSEHFIDAQVAAAREIGVRFHPTRGSMDLSVRDGGLPPESVVQSIPEILRDSERVIAAYHDASPGAMVRIGLAPCSPFSVTPELMRESAALARQHGVRLHTHIAETTDEDAYSRETFGMSPIALLESLGWAGPDVWVAHCVHPSRPDIDLLASGGVSVAHCPTSNMLLGSGLAPVRRLLSAGITVGLGVDGSASNDGNDLRNEMKQALLVARVRDGADAMSARAALRLATRGGAACLGRDDIGSIEAGKAADIVFFDLDRLELAGGARDIVASVVLGAARPHTVLVHGEPVVRAGVLTRADATALAARQNEASARLHGTVSG